MRVTCPECGFYNMVRQDLREVKLHLRFTFVCFKCGVWLEVTYDNQLREMSVTKMERPDF